jgi:hypothetical protein
MDLLAELREARTGEQTRERPAVGASLLIECINNRWPLVFFEKQVTWTESYHVPTLLGTPLHVHDKPGSSGFVLLEDEANVSWRRSVSNWSTQYCTFDGKSCKGRSGKDKATALFATQSPDHHGTFEKLIVEAERVADEVMNEGLIQAGWMGGWLALVRPVVVLQGRLIAATPSGDDVELSERMHMHYLRRGVVGERRVAWVFDVVTEDGFRMYLDWVSDTLERVRRYCLAEREKVQEAFGSESTRRLSLSARSSSR